MGSQRQNSTSDSISDVVDEVNKCLRSKTRVPVQILIDMFDKICGRVVVSLPDVTMLSTTSADRRKLEQIVLALCQDLLQLSPADCLDAQKLYDGHPPTVRAYIAHLTNVHQAIDETINDSESVSGRSSRKSGVLSHKSVKPTKKQPQKCVLHTPRTRFARDKLLRDQVRQRQHATIMRNWEATSIRIRRHDARRPSHMCSSSLSRAVVKVQTRILRSRTTPPSSSTTRVPLMRPSPTVISRLSSADRRRERAIELRRAQAAIRNASHSLRVRQIRHSRRAVDAMENEVVKETREKDKAEAAGRAAVVEWRTAARKAQESMRKERPLKMRQRVIE